MVRNGQKLLDVVESDWMWFKVAISGHSDPDPCWWLFLTTTDYFWQLQRISSHFQPHPAIFSHFWSPVTPSSHFWWPFLTTPDYFWPLQSIYRHFQPLLTTSSKLCPFRAIFGYVWPFLATCDSFHPLLMNISYHSWLVLTITKHLQTFQPLLTTSIHLCPFWAIFDNLWPHLTTSTHFWWPFLTTNDHFWPFEGPKS